MVNNLGLSFSLALCVVRPTCEEKSTTDCRARQRSDQRAHRRLLSKPPPNMPPSRMKERSTDAETTTNSSTTNVTTIGFGVEGNVVASRNDWAHIRVVWIVFLLIVWGLFVSSIAQSCFGTTGLQLI